jgi:hypothetical protein
MNRYLFLDIDGVLNTGNYSNFLVHSSLPESDGHGYFFDPDAVEGLKKVIDATNADIILASDWRVDGFDNMQSLWVARNMPGKLAGITPSCKTTFTNIDTQETWSKYPVGSRGMEVAEWLLINGRSPYSYAIVDDEDNYLLYQSEHLVLTNPMNGLDDSIADVVISILSEDHLVVR